MFRVLAEDGSARVGELTTRSGAVQTPFFMPVLTNAADRRIGPKDYHELGAGSEECSRAGIRVAIANSLIAAFEPGTATIRAAGGLHRWLATDAALFTDSGGYQTSQGSSFVAERQEDGYCFTARWSGAQLRLTPRLSVAIQEEIGSDVAMVLDDMAPFGAEPQALRACVERTHLWAEQALNHRSDRQQLLFGICQGGLDPELRARSASFIDALGFDGVAIGGVGVQRSLGDRLLAVRASVGRLSRNRARYVMGVGDPATMLAMVQLGVDCFDAAYPSILARRGQVLTARGVKEVVARSDLGDQPIDKGCPCATCARVSFQHLGRLKLEMAETAFQLACTHNVYFLGRFMSDMRTAIKQNGLERFRRRFLQRWRSSSSA